MNGKGYKVLIGLLAALLVAMGGIIVAILYKPVAVSVTPPTESQSGLSIGYASRGVTILDESSLQQAVDEMYAASRQSGIGIRYQNDAYSSNGRDFTCSIGNPARNEYDMFIAIYADDTLQDLLFLSELLRPGEAFNNIQLTRALEPGTHTVNCVFTQVEVVDGEQAIHAQTAVTLNFHVQ